MCADYIVHENQFELIRFLSNVNILKGTTHDFNKYNELYNIVTSQGLYYQN